MDPPLVHHINYAIHSGIRSSSAVRHCSSSIDNVMHSYCLSNFVSVHVANGVCVFVKPGVRAAQFV